MNQSSGVIFKSLKIEIQFVDWLTLLVRLLVVTTTKLTAHAHVCIREERHTNMCTRRIERARGRVKGQGKRREEVG